VRAGPEVSPCPHPCPFALCCRKTGSKPLPGLPRPWEDARWRACALCSQRPDEQRGLGGGDHGVDPDLVDKAVGIIAGHGRVLAAQLLGLKEVPVVVRAGLDPSSLRLAALGAVGTKESN
jgi:hypothetical protein